MYYAGTNAHYQLLAGLGEALLVGGRDDHTSVHSIGDDDCVDAVYDNIRRPLVACAGF
jgi:hypothetical protein